MFALNLFGIILFKWNILFYFISENLVLPKVRLQQQLRLLQLQLQIRDLPHFSDIFVAHLDRLGDHTLSCNADSEQR